MTIALNHRDNILDVLSVFCKQALSTTKVHLPVLTYVTTIIMK